MTELYTQAEKTEQGNPEFKPIEDVTPVLAWILAVPGAIVLFCALMWFWSASSARSGGAESLIDSIHLLAWIGGSAFLVLFAILAALLGINKKLRKKLATDCTERADQDGSEKE